jgi:hypothetical protein
VITRRACGPAAAVVLSRPAAAQPEFPPQIPAGGRVLVLNGIGSRLYSIFAVEVYRAALYLEARSSDADAIIASTGVRLVQARYRRDVPENAVVAAWEDSFSRLCACAMPAAFRAWLRPITAGAEERFLFVGEAATLEGPGRSSLRLPNAARQLLSAWIGAGTPTEAVRRGLLGLAR